MIVLFKFGVVVKVRVEFLNPTGGFPSLSSFIGFMPVEVLLKGRYNAEVLAVGGLFWWT